MGWHHQHHQPSAGARGPHPCPRVTAVGSEDTRSVQDVPNAEHAGHRVPVLEAPEPESIWGGPIRSTRPLPGEGAEAEEELCQLSSRAPGGSPGAATGGHLQEGPAQLVRATCGGKWVSDPPPWCTAHTETALPRRYRGAPVASTVAARPQLPPSPSAGAARAVPAHEGSRTSTSPGISRAKLLGTVFLKKKKKKAVLPEYSSSWEKEESKHLTFGS